MTENPIIVAELARQSAVLALNAAISETYPSGLDVEYQTGYSVHPSSWIVCKVVKSTGGTVTLRNAETGHSIVEDGRSGRIRLVGSYQPRPDRAGGQG